jgi:hypothetical protein
LILGEVLAVKQRFPRGFKGIVIQIRLILERTAGQADPTATPVKGLSLWGQNIETRSFYEIYGLPRAVLQT